jgi:hypothetical protein
MLSAGRKPEAMSGISQTESHAGYKWQSHKCGFLKHFAQNTSPVSETNHEIRRLIVFPASFYSSFGKQWAPEISLPCHLLPHLSVFLTGVQSIAEPGAEQDTSFSKVKQRSPG